MIRAVCHTSSVQALKSEALRSKGTFPGNIGAQTSSAGFRWTIRRRRSARVPFELVQCPQLKSSRTDEMAPRIIFTFADMTSLVRRICSRESARSIWREEGTKKQKTQQTQTTREMSSEKRKWSVIFLSSRCNRITDRVTYGNR